MEKTSFNWDLNLGLLLYLSFLVLAHRGGFSRVFCNWEWGGVCGVLALSQGSDNVQFNLMEAPEEK